MNYYNEIDKFAAAWLRELIREGHLPKGEVDERSILDVRPGDLVGFTQKHFFAGIGGWSVALALAGWPEDRPVWTGSCPCQPFSAAGKGGGFDDERHLWPAFHWLIAQSKPDFIFGEQVEGPDGRTWLDLVSTDLEGSGYAFGAAVFPAAGVGAPHGRHRTYWMADALHAGRAERGAGAGLGSLAGRGVLGGVADSASGGREYVEGGRSAGVFAQKNVTPPQGLEPGAVRSGARGVADPDEGQCGWLAGGQGSLADRQARGRVQSHGESQPSGAGGFLADPGAPGLSNGESGSLRGSGRGNEGRAIEQRGGASADQRRGASAPHGGWANADWLRCTDGRWRPVEPGTFPLAYGLSARLGRLRGYGNAIVPAQAAEFIKAYLDLGVIDL